MSFLLPNPPAQSSGGNQPIKVSQIGNLFPFGVAAGNGATLVPYGLNFTAVNLLGQNAPDPGGPSLLTRLYGYNQFSATTAWRMQSVTNASPFYGECSFGLYALFSRGFSGTFNPNNYGFGFGTAASFGTPPQDGFTDFFGIVDDGTANFRVVARNASVTFQNTDSNVAANLAHTDGVMFALEYEDAVTTASISRLNSDRTLTLLSQVSITGFVFPTNAALLPYFGGAGSLSGSSSIACVLFNGYARVTA